VETAQLTPGGACRAATGNQGHSPAFIFLPGPHATDIARILRAPADLRAGVGFPILGGHTSRIQFMEHSKSVPTTGLDKTIVDVMTAPGKFTTFVEALKAGGLLDTLNGKGPFTVFAPTDESFKKLPRGAYEDVLKDTAKLNAVLKYHIVPGTIMAKDVRPGELNTLQGSPLTTTVAQDVRVNGARVVQGDILAKNGVIHAIDTVILPKHLQLLAAAA
jgi:uncharacterized surface protein with fasciclin (FAS1) repeats